MNEMNNVGEIALSLPLSANDHLLRPVVRPWHRVEEHAVLVFRDDEASSDPVPGAIGVVVLPSLRLFL